MVKLNMGCGSAQPEGWVNADLDPSGDAVFADLRERLPWDTETFEVIVASYVLSDLTYHELPNAMAELHRVLTVDGVLRVLVPSLDAMVYNRANPDWFPMDDDVKGDARLCAMVTWFGESRSVFTYGYLRDLFGDAGFVGVSDPLRYGLSFMRPGGTAIVSLDSRDREAQSLIVEGMKGNSDHF